MRDLRKLSEELRIEGRKIQWLECFLVAVLSSLIAYAIHRIFYRSWDDLLAVAIPISASLSALLIAVTATRLIRFNLVQKGQDDHEDRLREVQNAIILLDEIRGRFEYIKECHMNKPKPLVGLLKSIEEIEKLYQTFLSKEATIILPAAGAGEIYKLSSSIFGIAAGLDWLAAHKKNEPESTVFFGDLEHSPEMVKSIDELDSQMEKVTRSLTEAYEELKDALDFSTHAGTLSARQKH